MAPFKDGPVTARRPARPAREPQGRRGAYKYIITDMYAKAVQGIRPRKR